MTDGQIKTPSQFNELKNIRAELVSKRQQQRPTLWIGLLIVAVVLLLIAAIIQVNTPKTVTVPITSFISTNSNNTIPNLRKVTYTGPTPDFPNQLSIFSATPVLGESEMIQDLSAKYGLLHVNPKSNLWTNGGLSLFRDTSAKNYILTLKDLADEQLPIVNSTLAEQVATTYLKDTFPQVQLRPMMDQASYFVIGLEIEEASKPDEATGVNIPYTVDLGIENFPVVFEKADQPLFIVTIDGNNTVRLVTFYPQFQQYSKLEAKTTLSIQQALEQIQNGVASILRASVVDFDKVKMSDLTAATFTAVTIEYRLDSQSNLLLPFYKLSGTATSANKVTADIEVITPAVQTTSITRP